EAGLAVGGDLARQVEFPLQIGAHRRLVSLVAVVVPEHVVDALAVGRVAGRGLDRQPGRLPGGDTSARSTAARAATPASSAKIAISGAASTAGGSRPRRGRIVHRDPAGWPRR